MADDYTRRLATQFAVDRTQIDNRRILGDDLARPRDVEHFATFPSDEQATAAAASLERLGFRGSTLCWSDRHSLCAVRSDAIDEESARAFVRDVTEVVDAHGGSYDGWGAPIVPSRRPLVSIPDSPADIDWH